MGIKNYGSILFDTATTRLFYTGNFPKPSIIISPNTIYGRAPTPAGYDTTHFSYDVENRLVKDSVMIWGYYNTPQLIKQPSRRLYFYPDSLTIFVHWYAVVFAGQPPALLRQDTIKTKVNKVLSNIKTQFFSTNNQPSNYALAEGFNYDTIINPLAKLNIGRMIFSYLYTPTYREILGNQNHKAVWNSNILPDYLDFFSPVLPSSFHLSGFYADGFLIGAQSDAFSIQVIPWSKRLRYPLQITVGASTALPGDRFVYKYYYR